MAYLSFIECLCRRISQISIPPILPELCNSLIGKYKVVLVECLSNSMKSVSFSYIQSDADFLQISVQIIVKCPLTVASASNKGITIAIGHCIITNVSRLPQNVLSLKYCGANDLVHI